jgi:hypothetical protein
MGKLRPIGSEKLQGMDKIKRMIEISTYKENIPNPLNETSSHEYDIKLSDGNRYHIIKEKSGYVIKKGLTESTSDYIEPMKGRKYYSSYSQAFKRLNLIAKEVNVNEGFGKNISLFNEGDNDEVKYYLKTSTNEQDVPAENPAPAPAPAPAPSPSPAPAPAPEMDDMGGEESSEMDDMSDEPIGGEEDNEEEVSFKSIQKLTGKLAQKLRELMGNEDEEISSKDKKYVINSILSAIELESMEEDDKDDIIDKLEGEEDMEGSEESSQGEEDMDFSDDMADQEIGGEDMGQESTPPPAPTEMGEMYDNEDDFTPHRPRFRNKVGHRDMNTDDVFDGMFNESKIDKVLEKYFEPKIKKQVELTSNIERISETTLQESSAKSFINKFPSAKLIGKNKLGNIIFETDKGRKGITPKGTIL